MLKIITVDDIADPYRSPDLGWNGLSGDLLLNSLTHPDAPGDFRAEQGLATQVLICLMTDARVDDSELRGGDENRGWLGDSFDRMSGEAPLGSKLWLLGRSSLTPDMPGKAENYAALALQTLIDQGACVRVDAVATPNYPGNRMDLAVALYGRDGTKTYSQKFQLLWGQIDGVVNPLAG